MAAPVRLAIKNAIRAARDAVDHEMNRHITEALGDADGAEGAKKEGLPRKLWDRFKSKIDSLGEKPSPAVGDDRRRSGDE